MADKLTNGSAGAGHNSGATREQLLDWMNRMDEAEADLASRTAACKEPRKDMKAIRKEIRDAGFSQEAFNRIRADQNRPASEREREHQQYQVGMAWLSRPLGFQSTMEIAPVALTAAELKRIDLQGFEAGKGGRNADENPYSPPGAEGYTRWHNAWLRGQAEIAESLSDPAPKRGRGRPRKDAETAPPPAAVQNGDAGAALLD